MVVTHNDILKDFDQRLRLFHFKSSRTLPETWQGSDIVQRVSWREMDRKYKCKEEQLITRLQLWTDVCRINDSDGDTHIQRNEKLENKLENGNKPIRVKNTYAKKEQMDRKHKSTLTPTKLPVFIAEFNKSCIESHDDSSIENNKNHKLSPMSLSFSADNLHGFCTDGFDSSIDGESEIPQKKSKSLKQRFKYLTCRIKTPLQKMNNPKTASLPREKTKRSTKSLNDKTDRCDSIESLDVLSTGRSRPSIFDMETLKDSIPQFSSNYEIKKRYCQTEHVRRKRILDDRRKTFNSEINKSFKGLGYEGGYRLDNGKDASVRYFYEPDSKRTDIGYV